MGDHSKIEWTDATWTPIRARRRDNGKVGVHCERVSEGCKHCYAATFNQRNLPSHGTGLDFTILNREEVDIFIDEEMLMAPLRWKRPRRIFACSQTDLFGEFVTDEMIDRVFAVMALAPQHTFQVLTKRPERMLDWTRPVGQVMRRDFVISRAARLFESIGLGGSIRKWPDWPLPNVWLGVTAENQEWLNKRIRPLIETPAAKRVLSVEPMLGPVDIWGLAAHIDWLICGGESGHGARPMHPDWARSLRDQCVAAGVPFFFKQWGEFGPAYNCSAYAPADSQAPRSAYPWGDGVYSPRLGKRAAGRLLDGREWSEFPEVTCG